MPQYDIHCRSCGYEETYLSQKVEIPELHCPKCSGLLEKKVGQLFNINGSTKGKDSNSLKQSPPMGKKAFAAVLFGGDPPERIDILSRTEEGTCVEIYVREDREKIEKRNQRAMRISGN